MSKLLEYGLWEWELPEGVKFKPFKRISMKTFKRISMRDISKHKSMSCKRANAIKRWKKDNPHKHMDKYILGYLNWEAKEDTDE